MIIELWEGQEIECNHRCDVRSGPCTRGMKKGAAGGEGDSEGDGEGGSEGDGAEDGMEDGAAASEAAKADEASEEAEEEEEEEDFDSDPEFDEDDLKAGGAASKVSSAELPVQQSCRRAAAELPWSCRGAAAAKHPPVQTRHLTIPPRGGQPTKPPTHRPTDPPTHQPN